MWYQVRRVAAVGVAASMAATLLSVLIASPAHADDPDDQVDIPVTGSPLSALVASPAPLTPGFSPTIHDYVVRCGPGVNSIAFTMAAASGGTIAAGNQSGSTVTVSVNLGESQAAVVQAPDAANPTGPVVEYWIRCLPHDFPQLHVATPGAVPPGWYLTGNVGGSTSAGSSPYAMILDQNGTPVWYQQAPGGAIDVESLPNDTIAWTPSLGPGIGTNPNGAFYLYQLDTQTAGSQAAPDPPTDPHELLQMANGDRMMIASPLKTVPDLGSVLGTPFAGITTIVDCLLEEVNSQDNVVWEWRMSDHVGVDEAKTIPMLASTTMVNGQPVADVFHCNSVDVDPNTGNVLVSSRHTSAVYLIDKVTKKITWKLGGTGANHDNAKILTLASDPESGFSGQHDARFQANGDVSLYDDHTGRMGAARGVEYAIDTTAGTATWKWQYAAPDGASAGATGSFRRYANGTDNVVGWGFKAPGSGFTEVDGDGNKLMDLTFPNGEQEYRVIKVPPTALDINLLRQTAGLPRPAPAPVSFQSLGGVLTSKPTAAAWAPDRLDVFGRGTDNQLWHRWWDGTQWSGWEPLGGILSSGPAVAAWAPNRLDVFVQGTDSELWHRWWDGTRWSGWEPLGGVLSSGPSVASWGNGRLDVVVQGTDNEVWHTWWDGIQWSPWEPLGGQVRGDPAVSSWGTGRLDLFIRNTDNTLSHRWYDGGQWSGWEWFAASLSAGPAATSAGPVQVDVIGSGPGPGSGPLRLEYAGAWQNWRSLGGQLTAQTPAVVPYDSALEAVLVTGTDGTLWFGALSAPSAADARSQTARPAAPTSSDAAKL